MSRLPPLSFRESYVFTEKNIKCLNGAHAKCETSCGYYAAGLPLGTGSGRQRGSQ